MVFFIKRNQKKQTLEILYFNIYNILFYFIPLLRMKKIILAIVFCLSLSPVFANFTQTQLEDYNEVKNTLSTYSDIINNEYPGANTLIDKFINTKYTNYEIMLQDLVNMVLTIKSLNDWSSTLDAKVLSIVSNLKQENVIIGDPNAKFTIIEYTSPTCIFCERQYNDRTLDQTLEKFNNVNYVPVIYSRSEIDTEVGQILACALELSWEETYLETYDYMFTNGYNSILDTEYINYKFGIDWLEECVESQSYYSTIQTQTTEAFELLNVLGTPGNIIVNTKTGEFENIPGAYPLDTFIDVISQMQ